MKYRILVVEDNPEHLADMQKTLLILERKFLIKKIPISIEPVYAVNLLDAMKLLDSVDAVMSDVFFPRQKGGKEEDCGVEMMKKSLFLRKAVVLITSTWHHGAKTQPVCLATRDYGIEMIDANPKDPKFGEADHKKWGPALVLLLGQILAFKQGMLHYVQEDQRGADGYVYLRKGGVEGVGGRNVYPIAFEVFCKKTNWNEEECREWVYSL